MYYSYTYLFNSKDHLQFTAHLCYNGGGVSGYGCGSVQG